MPFLALSSRFSKHALYSYAPATTVLGDHCSWLASKRDDRTFSYIHLSDLHQPVSPPEQYARQFRVDTDLDDLSEWRYTDKTALEGDAAEYVEHRRRLYRAAVRYVNDSLSRYYRFLTDELGSDVTLIVTADHGEGFWEHAALDAEHFVDTRPAYCVGHGGTPYECISRVPLLVDGISLDALESDGIVSLIDVTPTILETVGLTCTTSIEGRSLLYEIPSSRVVLTESARYGYEKKAMYYDGWKYLVSKGDDTSLGFSLPGERRASVPPEIKRTMTETLPAWPATDGTGAETTVSKTVEKRLDNLGYK
jgi:arylsulfatase A-like enzyme